MSMSRDNLPRPGVIARGLSRLDAAAYVGVSPVTFDKLVADGIIPAPVKLRGRKVYDRFRIDADVFGDLTGTAANDDERDCHDEDDGLAELRAALGVSGAP